MPELNIDPGEILIFKNDKGDNPKRPGYRGELVTPDGQSLEVALWVRKSNKDGSSFFSGKVQEPREEMPAPKQTTTDDDIPF